ncbi:hypothetical protein Pmar_PMAR013584, partial [Perkinsus marinus ATCC 50983]
MAMQGKPSVEVGEVGSSSTKKKKTKTKEKAVPKTKSVATTDKKKVVKPKRQQQQQHGSIKAKAVDQPPAPIDGQSAKSRVRTPVPPLLPTANKVVAGEKDVSDEVVVKRSDSLSSSSSLRKSTAAWEESSSSSSLGTADGDHQNKCSSTNNATVQPFEDPLEPQQLSASLEMLFKQAPVYDRSGEEEASPQDDSLDDDLDTLLKSLDGSLLVEDQQGTTPPPLAHADAAVDSYGLIGSWRSQQDIR